MTAVLQVLYTLLYASFKPTLKLNTWKFSFYPGKQLYLDFIFSITELYFFFHSLVFKFPLSAPMDPSLFSVLNKLFAPEIRYLMHIFYTVALHENGIMICAQFNSNYGN